LIYLLKVKFQIFDIFNFFLLLIIYLFCFIKGSLRFLNWDNVFCAGGSVLASLTPVPDKFSKRNQLRREYFHEKAYPASDIDLFIYGLDEEQGKEKLTEIYQSVCDAIPYEVIAFRSKHAITLVSQYPHRHIQVLFFFFHFIFHFYL